MTDQGLSLAKMNVLGHLVDAGEPLPLGQLAERIQCVKSNVTQLVDRLEGDGLVRRVPDPHDRRSVFAAITDEGRKRYEAAGRARVRAEQELLQGLPEEARQQLSGLLQRLERRAALV
ncbi:MAG: MarR family transcriptional regulator [Gemmatimonadetes bacterium]|nr:MarR family transcriptional regulator [Gemmatimonadota bacterium]